jgi:hypothetical protein
MPGYYDRRGKRITLMQFIKMFEKNRVVQQDKIGEVRVSTVWLGVDHNFSEYGPPLIFESMIFGGEHDREQRRYPTLEQAKAGHAELVAMVLKEQLAIDELLRLFALELPQ